jgi:hypothetical protein
MFFRKTEHKRNHPYVAMTIGTLAMIGAFNVVRCTKRTVRHAKNKMECVFRGKKEDYCPME